METITHDNYEAWFIDYLDGQLVGDQIDQLLDFISENPELREELEKVASFSLIPAHEEFPHKSALKHSMDEIPGIPAADLQCIARLEEDLNPEMQAEFDRKLTSDPKIASMYAGYQYTKLKPDAGVRYPHPQELKKKTRVLVPWLVTAISAAAVVVLVLLLWPGPGLNNGQLTAGREDAQSPASRIELPSSVGENPDHQQPPLVAELAPAQTIRTGIQKLPVKKNPDSKPDMAGRDIIRMEPLTQKFYHSGTSIPNPVSSPVLYAGKFSISDFEKSDSDYLTLPQFALQFIREKLLGQDPVMVRQTRFTLWEVADASLDKVNTIFASGMDLNRQYGENGNLIAVSFNSRLVDVDAPLRRKE